MGLGKYLKAAFANRKPLKLIEPSNETAYNMLYQEWKYLLENQLHKTYEANTIINL